MKNLNFRRIETNSKGITLVALVISIIVLLILATVSIGLVINNEILDKVKYGVDKSSDGEIEEQIKLGYIAYKTEVFSNSEIDVKEYLKNSLEKVFKNEKIIIIDNNYMLKINIGDNKYILKDGNVEKVVTNEDYLALNEGDHLIYTFFDNKGKKYEVECVVLYDSKNENFNSYGVQIITNSSLEDIRLGNDIGKSSNEMKDFEKAKYSYNNAINILNSATKKYLNETIAYNSRCVRNITRQSRK